MPYADPEKKRENKAKYRAAHPEKARANDAKYRAAHPEKIRAKSAKYRAAHPEKEMVRHAVYDATHREERRAYHAALYQRRKEFYYGDGLIELLNGRFGSGMDHGSGEGAAAATEGGGT